MMPPELKTEGLCCVGWLLLAGVRGFSSKSWSPRWGRRPVCLHDENDTFLSEYFDIFKHISCTRCASCCFLSLHVRFHVHCHGCREATGVHPLLRRSPISLSPHPPRLNSSKHFLIFCAGCDSCSNLAMSKTHQEKNEMSL